MVTVIFARRNFSIGSFIIVIHRNEVEGFPLQLLLLLFATTRSVFKSVKVSVVEIAKRTN